VRDVTAHPIFIDRDERWTGVRRRGRLGDMLSALNGALHGPVHIMIGGHWSFDEPKWAGLANETWFDPDTILLASKVQQNTNLTCLETVSRPT
jgi:hypothetical protein